MNSKMTWSDSSWSKSTLRSKNIWKKDFNYEPSTPAVSICCGDGAGAAAASDAAKAERIKAERIVGL